MRIVETDRTHGEGVTIELKPGMAWAIYLDDGPEVPCVQSMRVTCPHTVLHVWPSEQAMLAAIENQKLWRNRQNTFVCGVIDNYTHQGVFQIRFHEEEQCLS